MIDAWYDSGSMPFAQFHYPFEGEEPFAERFPADFISEAIDQTRGWFYSLLAVSTLVFDRTSYRNCVCLGLILDPEGQKMSKSRGNVVDPWEVIARHGADAFRWYYFTAQQPWAGYRFSTETVGEAVRQFMLTLWNTYSFWVLYANAEGLEPTESWTSAGQAAPTTSTGGRCPGSRGRSQTVIEHMDAYDCTSAGRAIADYVEELSNWYVRLSRRRFWEGDRTAFATLRRCLLDTAALLAPFTPFLADEIHANLAAGAGEDFGELPDSVHLRDFPEPDNSLRRRAARGGDGGGPPHRRARSRGARAGRDQGAPAACAGRSWSPTTPSGRRSRPGPRSSPRSSTSRSSTSSPRSPSW